MHFIKKKLLLQLVVIITCVVLVYFFPDVFDPIHKQHVPTLTAGGNVILFEQPAAGSGPILDSLNHAQKEILVEMYLLTDKKVIEALGAAVNRGVIVKVLLEQHPYQAGSLAQGTYKTLISKNVLVNWTNQDFLLTHEKAIIVDEQQLFVLNQNVTTASFDKNREYDIIDSDQTDVIQAKKIFLADWDRTPIKLEPTHLIVSPYNAREGLENLIKNSQKSVDIEMEVITDPEVQSLLLETCKTRPVRIIMADFSKISANQDTANAFKAGCVQVKTLKNPYVHAKLIISDQQSAYIGSVNFTSQSLDKNRELGILLSQEKVVSELNLDFANDWLLAD